MKLLVVNFEPGSLKI